MAERKEQLRTDLTAAMKARDKVATGAIRMALAGVMKAETAGDTHRELSNDEVDDVLRVEVRRRHDATEIYAKAGRDELAEKETTEATILRVYLPAAMPDEDLSAIVAEAVAQAAADGQTGPRALGGVIKLVRELVGPRADGGRIAAAVKAALAE
jgi:uncharacterized protein YqeY